MKDIGPQKIALSKVIQCKKILSDSLVLCFLLPYSFAQMAELTGSVTGYDTSVTGQLRVAERILTMFRIFKVREGFNDVNDKLPERFFGPTFGGPLSNVSLFSKI